jgi:hypothetical protein
MGALRAAKIEIDNGNYYDAYQEMRALAEPGSSATHWDAGQSTSDRPGGRTQFSVRIVIKVPEAGIGTRYMPMANWLDEHCGIDGWAFASAGTCGLLNDAIAVYVNTPACALAFVARWLVPGNDPLGFYELRPDEPGKRVPLPAHKAPL